MTCAIIEASIPDWQTEYPNQKRYLVSLVWDKHDGYVTTIHHALYNVDILPSPIYNQSKPASKAGYIAAERDFKRQVSKLLKQRFQTTWI